MIHFVTIDLKTSELKVLVTPKTADNARTTSDFARKFKPQLAINASFFGPFHENTPWDYYPRTGDRAEPLGEVISNGDRYSLPLFVLVQDVRLLIIAIQKQEREYSTCSKSGKK